MNTYIENQTDIIHETSVDFVLRPCSKEIHIVQYDKSLPIIKVELFKNGERFSLPEDAIVNIRFGKLDRTFVYKSILGTNVERNIVYFEVDEQMAIIPGRVWPVLEVIYSNGKIASSSPIHFIIERNPVQDDYVESEEYFPIIYELQFNKLDKVTEGGSNRVYGIDTNGEQKTFTISQAVAGTSIVQRDNQGHVKTSEPVNPTDAVNKNYVDTAIESIEMRSDVIDVLGTYADLEDYDTSDVRLNDLIKVISDETHNNAISYYRWENISDVNQWVYVASEGPYYTISEVNTIINRVDDDIDALDNRKLELHPFNGFVGGSQVHEQIQNGQIKYCQSGTQSTIDPSQSPIINIELTQEHISAVSNKKAMYIKKIHIEYELDSEIGVNKIWEYEFTSRIFGSGSASDDINPKVVSLSDITTGLELEWTLIYRPATGKQYYGSYTSAKGQQFGSNTHPSDYISLYTTSIQNATIKNVWIEVSGNTGTTAKIKLTLVQDQWTVNDIVDPNITANNEQYIFYHEGGTHLGTGSGEIIEYNHVFLRKEKDIVTSISAKSEYLYIEEDPSKESDTYRLYKYVDDQMQEVSKTRLGTTSDTAYRGDYGQDNYNKLKKVIEQHFEFVGEKEFHDPVTFDGEDVAVTIHGTLHVDIIGNLESGPLLAYDCADYVWDMYSIRYINVGMHGADIRFLQSEYLKPLTGEITVGGEDVNQVRLLNIADPINNMDAANKQYVDNNINDVENLIYKKSRTIYVSYNSLVVPKTDGEAAALKKEDGTYFTDLNDFNEYVSGHTFGNGLFNSYKKSIIIYEHKVGITIKNYLITKDNFVLRINGVSDFLKDGDSILVSENNVPNRLVLYSRTRTSSKLVANSYETETSMNKSIMLSSKKKNTNNMTSRDDFELSLKINLINFNDSDVGKCIYLYRKAKQRMSGLRKCYKHPKDLYISYEPSERYVGYTYMGYKMNAGHKMSANGGGHSLTVYTPVPTFMPREGTIQTEWILTQEDIARGYIEIDICREWVSLISHYDIDGEWTDLDSEKWTRVVGCQGLGNCNCLNIKFGLVNELGIMECISTESVKFGLHDWGYYPDILYIDDINETAFIIPTNIYFEIK